MARGAVELIRCGARFALAIVDLASPGDEFPQDLPRRQADLKILFLTSGVETDASPDIPNPAFITKPILPYALLKAVELTLKLDFQCSVTITAYPLISSRKSCKIRRFLEGIAIAPSCAMQASASAGAWTSFEACLASMRPGDVITVDDAVTRTGMTPESVQVVLEGLTRADLFEQHAQYFVRVSVRPVDTELGGH